MEMATRVNGKKRLKPGLPHLRTTPDALPRFLAPENIQLFETYKVLNEKEVHARYIAKAEQYAKLLNIEANTMSYMCRHMYLPALIDYSGKIAQGLISKKQLGIKARSEEALLIGLTEGIDEISDSVELVERLNTKAHGIQDVSIQDRAYLDDVIPAMRRLRVAVDKMEKVCSHEAWPVPTYNKILFYV